MNQVLVTGCKGQLGSELKRVGVHEKNCNYTFIDFEEMDLSNEGSIGVFFAEKEFHFLIHCAAYTAVDKAEDEPEVAYRVNSEATRILADICKSKNIRMIYISTDYVFDGRGNVPISESNHTNPLSVYGKSKLDGEDHVLRSLSDAYVIRTSWVYSTFGKNFVKTIAKLAREKSELNVVADQIGTPTYARDLAVALVDIIRNVTGKIVDQPGIYHYSNEGAISWYDLAYFITAYYKLPCKINPIPSDEYKTLAVRPRFSVLNKKKIKTTFGLSIPHWHKSLVDCLEQLSL